MKGERKDRGSIGYRLSGGRVGRAPQPQPRPEMVRRVDEIVPRGLTPTQRVAMANLNAADLTASSPRIQQAFLTNPNEIPENPLLEGFFRLGLVAVEIAEGKLTRKQGVAELRAMETALNDAIRTGNEKVATFFAGHIRFLCETGLRKIESI